VREPRRRSPRPASPSSPTTSGRSRARSSASAPSVGAAPLPEAGGVGWRSSSSSPSSARCSSAPGNVLWNAVDGDDDERFDVIATVLETAGRGAQVCTGRIAASYPPQCSGRPIAGWSWDDVDGEQSVGGTTWGEYRLVGTWDGERVTLDERPTTPRYEY
jgi:hypothetical protein